ncbi:MAG: sulfatase [Planctomycetota bacterium]|nr:sulfatase [Planctomycetota bacterium]
MPFGLLLAALVLGSERPSVVLIYCDDLGYADIGPFGAKAIRTPNLDRLAREGRSFTNFHVAQPVCSASRAALLTGCYPNRIGIHGALGPNAKHGIAAGETTMAEMLRDRGYATACVGKWHLGHLPPFLPTNHGFDRYFGLPYSNDMWPNHPEARPGSYPPLPLFANSKIIDPAVSPETQSTLTGRYTTEATQFIEQSKDRPFFLYLAHSMPHVPLFAGKGFQGKSKNGTFADVIEEIDASTGAILSTLDRAGRTADTIVIFTSDNGPWLSYGNHAGSAGLLREGKGTVWEGGVRVPCIMRWPGKITPGTRSNAMGMTIDLLPTMAQWTGSRLPEHIIDGRDIGTVLTSDKEINNPHDGYAYYYENNQLQAVLSGDGRWKLILPHSYRTLGGLPGGNDGTPAKYVQRRIKQPELYDLNADVGETMNVSERHPDIIARLLAFADRTRNDLGDSLTQKKATGTRAAGQAP